MKNSQDLSNAMYGYNNVRESPNIVFQATNCAIFHECFSFWEKYRTHTHIVSVIVRFKTRTNVTTRIGDTENEKKQKKTINSCKAVGIYASILRDFDELLLIE